MAARIPVRPARKLRVTDWLRHHNDGVCQNLRRCRRHHDGRTRGDEGRRNSGLDLVCVAMAMAMAGMSLLLAVLLRAVVVLLPLLLPVSIQSTYQCSVFPSPKSGCHIMKSL